MVRVSAPASVNPTFDSLASDVFNGFVNKHNRYRNSFSRLERKKKEIQFMTYVETRKNIRNDRTRIVYGIKDVLFARVKVEMFL